MAFQFKRDRGDNITLTLAGDIDLEVTPEIKTQLASQIEDATTLSIDAANVSYLDSSGVSILVIAMQSCKQKQINFNIPNMSEEAMRVLQLAKLDKILPVKAVSGPAQLVDVDVFSKTGEVDSALASEVAENEINQPAADAASGDDDLIAALASGDMSGGGVDTVDMAEEKTAASDTDDIDSDASNEIEQPIETSEAAAQPMAEREIKQETPSALPTPAASDTDDQSGGGGGFTPGTFG